MRVPPQGEGRGRLGKMNVIQEEEHCVGSQSRSVWDSGREFNSGTGVRASWRASWKK